MKEYWVNVYEGAISQARFNGPVISNEIKAKEAGGGLLAYKLYRLHVREFETKEAKELYLAYKYNKPKTGRMIVQNIEQQIREMFK